MLKNDNLSLYTSLRVKKIIKRNNLIFIISLFIFAIIFTTLYNLCKNLYDENLPNSYITRLLEFSLLLSFIFTLISTNSNCFSLVYSNKYTIYRNILLTVKTCTILCLLMIIFKIVLIKFNIYDFPNKANFINFNKFISVKSIDYLFTAFIQELLIRCYIHNNIKKLFITNKYSSLITITITSFLFGITHLHYTIMLSFISMIYISITGYIYEKNHSLATVTIIHFILGRFASLLYFFS